jgi:hypothetical protein
LYDEKARTADNSGSDLGPGFGSGLSSDLNTNPNPDLPYEIELGFGFEWMDILEKDRKDFAA